MTMTSEGRMAKDAELVVSRVANGYMVSERPDRGAFVPADEALVFPSFAALVEFLGKHFTHRAHAVPMDPAPQIIGAMGQAHADVQQAINAHARAQLDAMPFAATSLSGAAIIEG